MENNYVVSRSDKSKKVTLFLCIFGGMVGLHNFYVGKFLRGIIFLFTIGLFGFGWVYDIIKIAMGQFTDSVGAPVK